MSTDSSRAENEPVDECAAPVVRETHDEAFTDDDGVLYDDEVTPEYGILGFTLRELLIVGFWLVAFVASFFPLHGMLSPTSIWGQTLSWIQPIGLPTLAVFLIVLRRFSPDGIRRVGSLGIDQFASAVFSFGAFYWAMIIVERLMIRDVFLVSWVMVVEFLALLALVAVTVFAPLIPGLQEDFRGRLVTLAHRNANPVRPVIARPRAPRPVKPVSAPSIAPTEDAPHDDSSRPDAVEVGSSDDDDDDVEIVEVNDTDDIIRLGSLESVPLTAHASAGALGTSTAADDSDPDYVPGYARRRRSTALPAIPGDAEAARVASGDEAVAGDADKTGIIPTADSQPFWALAATERDVLDESGEKLFTIGPDAWALVIEDRGGAYVIRNDDGRIGYLHDIEDITKG
ncbi:hypothetical protein [Microbacterium sp. GXF6406]